MKDGALECNGDGNADGLFDGIVLGLFDG